MGADRPSQVALARVARLVARMSKAAEDDDLSVRGAGHHLARMSQSHADEQRSWELHLAAMERFALDLDALLRAGRLTDRDDIADANL